MADVDCPQLSVSITPSPGGHAGGSVENHGSSLADNDHDGEDDSNESSSDDNDTGFVVPPHKKRKYRSRIP